MAHASVLDSMHRSRLRQIASRCLARSRISFLGTHTLCLWIRIVKHQPALCLGLEGAISFAGQRHRHELALVHLPAANDLHPTFKPSVFHLGSLLHCEIITVADSQMDCFSGHSTTSTISSIILTHLSSSCRPPPTAIPTSVRMLCQRPMGSPIAATVIFALPTGFQLEWTSLLSRWSSLNRTHPVTPFDGRSSRSSPPISDKPSLKSVSNHPDQSHRDGTGHREHNSRRSPPAFTPESSHTPTDQLSRTPHTASSRAHRGNHETATSETTPRLRSQGHSNVPHIKPGPSYTCPNGRRHQHRSFDGRLSHNGLEISKKEERNNREKAVTEFEARLLARYWRRVANDTLLTSTCAHSYMAAIFQTWFRCNLLSANLVSVGSSS